MICELCQTRFGGRVTFATLYRAPRFCPRCLKRYHPGSHLAAVPIDGGLVRQAFVYDEENVDHHLSVLLFDRLGPFFLSASDWVDDGSAVILLEGAETASLPDWFPAVAAFRDVRFFSLFLVDLERYAACFDKLSENP